MCNQAVAEVVPALDNISSLLRLEAQPVVASKECLTPGAPSGPVTEPAVLIAENSIQVHGWHCLFSTTYLQLAAGEVVPPRWHSKGIWPSLSFSLWMEEAEVNRGAVNGNNKDRSYAFDKLILSLSHIPFSLWFREASGSIAVPPCSQRGGAHDTVESLSQSMSVGACSPNVSGKGSGPFIDLVLQPSIPWVLEPAQMIMAEDPCPPTRVLYCPGSPPRASPQDLRRQVRNSSSEAISPPAFAIALLAVSLGESVWSCPPKNFLSPEALRKDQPLHSRSQTVTVLLPSTHLSFL